MPRPGQVLPMLAVAGDLPDAARAPGAWRFEFKWDGIRALVHVDGERSWVVTRSGRERTSSFPELRGLNAALGGRRAILDGEIVALGPDGRADFQLLQSRINVAGGRRAEVLSGAAPVRYFAFDLLYLDDRSTIECPYLARRSLLEDLELEADHWAVPASHVGPGADLLDVARTVGLEGVVAKRADGRYRPGHRSPAWVKVKLTRTQEVVVGGWTEGRGTRRGTVGALLAGIAGDGGLVYAGKIGTGFSTEMLADLSRRLAPLRRPVSPFTGTVPAAEVAGAVWVEPCLVGEVRFTGWTRTGRLRHPSWRGLRPDKAPEEVVRET